MRKLRSDGLGIVFVTHFLDQVYAISNRITVLRNGLLVGEVDDVSAEPITAVPPELALSVEILHQIINELGAEKFAQPHDYNNAVWVGYRLSEVLPLKLSIRQNLLEMNDSLARLVILTDFLKKQTN